ncbi:hypothetical protein NQ317_018758 [Molorchus minor]|uniref:Carboxylesterase type B domain-containing protein n=1 Tax=Molorchus minor TaxID=1323400 RepID=A0ABQ9J186_9CUCU|nr:hypothetical protein NQ317_018758 [Molorchus minor]
MCTILLTLSRITQKMFEKVTRGVIFLFVNFVFSFADESDPLLVTLPNGQIRGHELESLHGKTYYGFQEIPYATPPVGNLRFKDPQPPENWDGVLDATKNTKICYQIGSSSTSEVVQTEDCLYLNVYTPVNPGNKTSGLPVLLWIHGGGFQWGDGTYQYYGPGFLMDYDIIVVTINYRLGPFGFLTTADGVIPANVALKDMTAAISWTHSNIGLFGGDPEKITINGESSGATAIGVLLLVQKASGLFRGAIIESGTSLCESTPQRYSKYFAYQMGYNIDQSFTNSSSSEELLELLQSVPPEDLITAHSQLTIPLGMENKLGDNRGAIWTAVIEDENVIDDPFVVGLFHENFKDGNINPVTTMIGFNSEEELHFVSGDWKKTLKEEGIYFDEDPSRLIHNKFNMSSEDKVKAGEELREIYTDGQFQDDVYALIKFHSDEVLTTPIIRQVELQSKYRDVYLYQFSYKGPLGGDGSIVIDPPDNVGHFEELSYIWDFHQYDISSMPEADILTHRRLLTLWTNFVKYLNPTPEEDELLQNAIWPKASPDSINYFNINVTLEAKTDPKRYQKWKPIIDKYANADTETLVVTLPYGKIRGHEVKSAYGTVYYGFQEIPYAAPPIGKLRFKDPVPPQNWDGILDATRNTKVCYQKPGAGFLTTADGVIPANLGLKDQTAAIEWTHSNIHLFGGDPDKITIVGESTGATAVGLQVLIKKADGLFRGAIIESGTVLCESTPQNYPRYYAYQMGSALDPTFSENNSSEELLELLQNASADDIRNHSNMTTVGGHESLARRPPNGPIVHPHSFEYLSQIPLGMENKIGPHRGQIWTAVIEDENIIDDAFLVGLFHENVKDGKINNVTTMIGYNSEEELHFLNDYANWTESFLELAIYFDEDTSRLIHNKFNMTDENKVMAGSRLRKIYTEGRFQDNLTALVKYFTDDVFSTPIVRQVTLQSSYSDIYLYQFSYKDGDNVGHGEDLMYMWDFHNVDISTMPESDILMHKRMLKMWTNFVKNPTPEEDELLENTIWPKASPDNVTYLNINATLTVGRDPKRYKLWHPIIDEYAIPPLVTY